MRGCILRDSVRRLVERSGMGVNYGSSSGIVGSCLGSKNELTRSCWRIGDIASVGGEVERARKEYGLIIQEI